MDRPRILIVDDEETIRHILVNVLEWNGCEVREAPTAEDGLSVLAEFAPDVALLDIVMPGRSGLDLLKDIKKQLPDTEVVMMTSHSSAETALRAIREGAYTYLQKPFNNLDEIWTTLQRALEKRHLTVRKRTLVQERDERSEKMASGLTLLEGTAAAAEAAAPDDLLNYFMDLVTDELGVDDACILLVNETAGELRSACRRTDGTRDPKPLALRIGQGICGSVAATGSAYVLTDTPPAAAGSNGSGPAAGETMFKGPVALCVPIQSERKVLGVFACGRRSNGEPFNDGDSAHLASLGAQLAVAVLEARRAARLETAYEKLKAAQDQLVRSERLKAVGQLAAGIAHDFNNVLSVIVARAEMLQYAVGGDALDRVKAGADLGAIIKAGLQGVQAIKRIQNYTRIRKDQPTAAVDVNEAVRDAVEISKPKWKQEAESKGVQIRVQLELGEIKPVAGNLLDLTQVVENLIFNAVDAMPKGGSIRLATSRQDQTVLLEVADTGTGMDEQTQKRLFEPFFTTKESGQGLGTSIVYGIVSRHQGSIAVDSRIGMGTTFRIGLPVFAPAETESTPPPAPAQPARRARVLLVDDEAAVRSAYHEALAGAGHDVVSAATGEEALAHVQAGRFDVVMTDLSMSGMTGYQVASAVKMLDPTSRVVLVSGWVIDPRSEKVRQSGIDEVLLKPCRIEDLREAVQRAFTTPVIPN